jgi:hypothetical protein
MFLILSKICLALKNRQTNLYRQISTDNSHRQEIRRRHASRAATGTDRRLGTRQPPTGDVSAWWTEAAPLCRHALRHVVAAHEMAPEGALTESAAVKAFIRPPSSRLLDQ